MLFIIFSQPNDSSLSMSESPRRFANQGLVYLSEIENVADIQDLSVKQAKDILAMNRVNFKGVVEKDELLKHVSRLWKQEKQAQEGMCHIQCTMFENCPKSRVKQCERSDLRLYI